MVSTPEVTIAFDTFQGHADAFDIYLGTGSLLTADAADPILWRYEHNDPRLIYLGYWGTTITPYASGGSFAGSIVNGAGVVFKFSGTAFQLLGKVGTAYGQAEMTIDGSPTPIYVDFHNATTVYKKVVYNTTLSAGEHTVLLKCTGTPIDLDALDITGYLLQAPTAARVEENGTPPSGSFTYGGTWTLSADTSASAAQLTSINTSGGYVEVTFTGTNLTWLAKTNKYSGKAKVTLDPLGVNLVTTVDLYSYTTAYKKVVYKTGVLTNTSHTLRIEWTGTKNPASLGTGIDVDAFDILGSIF